MNVNGDGVSGVCEKPLGGQTVDCRGNEAGLEAFCRWIDL